MDMRLAGKRALVTGSSAGLGRATVAMLAAEGVTVIVHGRDEARATAMAGHIRSAGGKAEVAVGDLAGDEGADVVANSALAGGPVDILVNNAGDYDHLPWELSGSGVTSNVVAPGAVMVDSVRNLLTRIAPTHGWGETWEEIERAAAASWIPNDVGRFGRPEEIAAAVVYLASPHADYVSGATLRVDGGTIRNVH